MAEDTRLGVGITTTADLTQLRAYQAELKATQAQLAAFQAASAQFGSTSARNAEIFGRETRALQAHATALQASIRGMTSWAAAGNSVASTASKLAGTELVAVHANLKNIAQEIETISRQSGSVKFQSLSQGLAAALGAGTEREIKSASESAKVLQASLSAMAATDATVGIQAAGGARGLSRAELKEASASVREMTGTTRGLAMAMGATAAEIDAAGSALNRFGRGGRTYISLFDEMMRGQRGQMASTLGAGLRSSGGGAGMLFGIAIPVGLAAAVSEVAAHFGHLAQQTQNAAAAAGMSVTQYSGLQRTLQLVDGNAGSLDRMLGILSGKMQDAITEPTSKAGDAFANLHVSAEQLADGLNNPIQMLETLRQAWQSFSSQPGLRTSIFHQLLGRQFQELAPYLRMTDDEIRALGVTAQETGSIMTDEMANGLDETGQAANRLSESFTGLGQTIAAIAGQGGGLLDFFANIVQSATAALKATSAFGKGVNQNMQQQSAGIGSDWWKGGKSWGDLLPNFGALRNPFAKPESAYSGYEPGPPTAPGVVPPAPYSFSGSQQQMQAELKGISDATSLKEKWYDFQIAKAGRNAGQVNSLEQQKQKFATDQAREQSAIHEKYARDAMSTLGVGGNDIRVKKLREGETQLQGQSYEIAAQGERRKQELQRQGETELKRRMESQQRAEEEQRAERVKSIREGSQVQLSHEQDVHLHTMRNANEQAAFAEARFGRKSPQFRAADEQKQALQGQSETARVQILDSQLAALQSQMSQDQSKLAGAKAGKPAGMDSNDYQNWVTQLQRAYDEDVDNFNRAQKQKQDVLNQQFQRQEQITIQIVQSQGAALKQQSDDLVADWAGAFNSIGSQAEATGQELLKDLFVPQKPEYWWSTKSGPLGQPLMVPHRISPEAQIAGELGTSIVGDLGKALTGTLTKSLAQGIFGGETKDLGTGLAKMIGIGGPGGLFGSGLGAVSNTLGSTASSTTFATSTTLFQTAVAEFQTAVATMSASSGASGATGGLGSILSGIPIIGSLFSGGGAAATAKDAADAVLAFGSGGVVPSAAGGWLLGPGQGATPAILHSREMVLPAHISTALQESIANGGIGGGGGHLHFHGPADAPSMERWFKNFMSANPSVIRNMFKYNSLTSRNLSLL